MLTLLALIAAGLVISALLLGARLAEAIAWRRSLLAIELRFPLGMSPDDVHRWLNTLAAATAAPRLSLFPGPPIALEVSADVAGARHLLLVPRALRATVLSGLRAAFPGVRVEEDIDYLRERPLWTSAAEAVLASQRRQMSVDRAEITATAVLSTLQPLEPGERVVVQWIIRGAGTPQPIPSMVAGRRNELPDWLAGEELTDSDAIRSARLKQADAMLHGTLRAAATASTAVQANAIVDRVLGQYRGLNAPGVRLTRRWWLPPGRAAEHLAQFRLPATRWPLLLSTREAAGLLPIPLGEVALPGVTVGLARQLPPPPGIAKAGAQIGISNYPDMAVPLRLADADRLQHLHVIGPTGVGKSTLLANLILQDIAAGHGVVVIDPKSDLVASVLARIPESQVSDVILVDPAATDEPVGFNLLRSGHDEQSRELVVDHIIHIWHELYEDFWGPRSEDVLRGALLTLINTKGANGEPFTLIETPDLLTAAPLRKFITEQAGVPAGLESFWHWYRGIRPDERLKVTGPILNKLRAFTLRTPIRLMLGQAEGLDLDQILAERKVLLVPLSANTIGAETASLLGSVLVAGVYFAVQRRATLPPEQRHPVFIHIDEAQTILNLPIDLADALAQARGLGASFTISHQHLGQIEDKLMRSALLGTVLNQIVFRCLRADADELAKSYEPYLTTADLMGLAKFEAAGRATVGNEPLAPFTFTTQPLPPTIRDGDALAEASRTRFGRSRADVEAALKARGHAPEGHNQADRKAGGTSDPHKFGRRRKPSVDREQGAA